VGYRGREESSGSLSAECRGYELRDREGEKVGKVDEVFVDDNDRPEYLGVKMGLLGSKLTLIPADLARADEDSRVIEISESRDRIKDAPLLGANEEITADRERGVRDHFGLDSGSSGSGSSGFSDAEQSQDEDTSEIQTRSAGYRQDPDEDRETRDQDQDSGNEREDESSGAAGEREPWADVSSNSSDSGDSSATSAEPSRAAAGAAGAAGAAAGSADRDRGESRDVEDTEGSESTTDTRDEPEARRSRGEGSGRGNSGGETMRVSIWREKARAEKLLGDDGNEEVRIRKEWVEEEEIVEVEDRRRG
jgi:hypothetical protein